MKASVRGISLIEVMAVIAIVGILGMTGVPTFSRWIAASRITTTTNELVASLAFARAEAIRSQHVVVVCRSVGTAHAEPACSNVAADGFAGNDWASGWVVFEKSDGGDHTRFEPTDHVLRHVPAARRGDHAGVHATTNTKAQHYAYRPDGLRAGGLFGFTFVVSHVGPDETPADLDGLARCVVISATGRARSGPRAERGCA